MLLDHGHALLLGETSEGEHTDLGGDVRPVSLYFLGLNGCAECLAHSVHSSDDGHKLIEPLFAIYGIVQDSCTNSGAMCGRG